MALTFEMYKQMQESLQSDRELLVYLQTEGVVELDRKAYAEKVSDTQRYNQCLPVEGRFPLVTYVRDDKTIPLYMPPSLPKFEYRVPIVAGDRESPSKITDLQMVEEIERKLKDKEERFDLHFAAWTEPTNFISMRKAKGAGSLTAIFSKKDYVGVMYPNPTPGRTRYALDEYLNGTCSHLHELDDPTQEDVYFVERYRTDGDFILLESIEDLRNNVRFLKNTSKKYAATPSSVKETKIKERARVDVDAAMENRRRIDRKFEKFLKDCEDKEFERKRRNADDQEILKKRLEKGTLRRRFKMLDTENEFELREKAKLLKEWQSKYVEPLEDPRFEIDARDEEGEVPTMTEEQFKHMYTNQCLGDEEELENLKEELVKRDPKGMDGVKISTEKDEYVVTHVPIRPEEREKRHRKKSYLRKIRAVDFFEETFQHVAVVMNTRTNDVMFLELKMGGSQVAGPFEVAHSVQALLRLIEGEPRNKQKSEPKLSLKARFSKKAKEEDLEKHKMDMFMERHSLVHKNANELIKEGNTRAQLAEKMSDIHQKMQKNV